MKILHGLEDCLAVRAKTETHMCTESSIVSTQSLSSLNSSANQAKTMHIEE